MKLLKLSGKSGLSTVVDDDDYEYLSQFKWHKHGFYVARLTDYSRRVNGVKRPTVIFLHRVVNQTPDGMVTDHINGDRLDNRRSNLRSCTTSQNAMNRKKRMGSAATGVNFDRRRGLWEARVCVSGKRVRIGSFANLEDAIAARSAAEARLFGQFAPSKLKKEIPA